MHILHQLRHEAFSNMRYNIKINGFNLIGHEVSVFFQQSALSIQSTQLWLFGVVKWKQCNECQFAMCLGVHLECYFLNSCFGDLCDWGCWFLRRGLVYNLASLCFQKKPINVLINQCMQLYECCYNATNSCGFFIRQQTNLPNIGGSSDWDAHCNRQNILVPWKVVPGIKSSGYSDWKSS